MIRAAALPRPSPEFLRFVIAGGLGFVIDAVLLLAFTSGLGWTPYLGRAVSFSVALLSTWLVNRLWTFRAHPKKMTLAEIGGEFLSYGAVQLTGGSANYLVYATVVAAIGSGPGLLIAALAAGSATGLFINYIGAKTLVFVDGSSDLWLQRWAGRAALLALGAGVLLIPALLNHGPFDAGAQLCADCSGALAGTSSSAYALALQITPTGESLWAVAWVQALAVAWLASLVLIEFRDKLAPGGFVGVMAVLAALSPAGFLTAWLAPGWFAGVLLLAGVAFALGARCNRAERIALWLLMAVSAAFQANEVALAALLVPILAVIAWTARKDTKRLVILAGPVAVLFVAPLIASGLSTGHALVASPSHEVASPALLSTWNTLMVLAYAAALAAGAAYAILGANRSQQAPEAAKDARGQFAAALATFALATLASAAASGRVFGVGGLYDVRLAWVAVLLSLAAAPLIVAALGRRIA